MGIGSGGTGGMPPLPPNFQIFIPVYGTDIVDGVLLVRFFGLFPLRKVMVIICSVSKTILTTIIIFESKSFCSYVVVFFGC